MATTPDASTPKPRKRIAAKPSSRPDAERVKLTLYLDADMAKRFSVHAAMMGLDKSELFAELVKAGCRRFVVSDRQSGAADQGDVEAA